ncbi:hypothetical protein PIB30_023303 [Stylosanthes scabra]|uniref:Uncharacterized protein n=1 Tax=Stylosanthes scabra TaxID=79078 RepID=A0ABU6R9M9_9FABA|nr:hypothetical protein [Stylosanthes scabra]
MRVHFEVAAEPMEESELVGEKGHYGLGRLAPNPTGNMMLGMSARRVRKKGLMVSIPKHQASTKHVQAWPRRDPRPKWRHDRALATPRRGLSPLTTPRCGREAHKQSRTAPSPCLSMARA